MRRVILIFFLNPSLIHKTPKRTVSTGTKKNTGIAVISYNAPNIIPATPGIIS